MYRHKSELQGWLRFSGIVAVVLFTYYSDKLELKTEISAVRTEIKVNATKPHYTIDQLSEVFLLIREWEKERSLLRRDINHLTDRFDAHLLNESYKNKKG